MEKFIFPIETYIQITSPYGERASTSSFHSGVDFGYCSLTRWNDNKLVQNKKLPYDGVNHKIIASQNGKVIEVRSTYKTKDSTGGSYGNYIKIDHGNKIHTLYGHLKYGSLKVKVGDNVKQGQVIALMGDTGRSSGVHLHFEYRIDGVKKDPIKYLYARDNQAIGSNIIEGKYKINYLPKYFRTPIARNENILQLEVFASDLRARKTANGEILGYINKGLYNPISSVYEGDYIWYQVEPNIWIAYSEKWAKIYEPKIIEEPIQEEIIEEVIEEIEEEEKPPLITPIEEEIIKPEKLNIFQVIFEIIKKILEIFKKGE